MKKKKCSNFSVVYKFYFLSIKLKASPLLMLDDVFDKLDEHRVKRILKKVSDVWEDLPAG